MSTTALLILLIAFLSSPELALGHDTISKKWAAGPQEAKYTARRLLQPENTSGQESFDARPPDDVAAVADAAEHRIRHGHRHKRRHNTSASGDEYEGESEQGPDASEEVHRHRSRHPWEPINATAMEEVLGFAVPQQWDDMDLSRVISDNLVSDVAVWRSNRRKLRISQLFAAATQRPYMNGEAHSPFRITGDNVRRVVEIRNGSVRFPQMPKELQHACNWRCDIQLAAILHALQTAPDHNVTLPDVLFLLNVEDHPVCRGQEDIDSGLCLVPFLSVIKAAWHVDLMLPYMWDPVANVQAHVTPWDAKVPKAFFRGSSYCHREQLDPRDAPPFEAACSRLWMARASQHHPNLTHILDVGLTNNFTEPHDPVFKDGKGPLPVFPHASYDDMARYKYLLQLDGITAATRYPHLLATNSLVLKESSPWLEWFYRSLRPYYHFIPMLNKRQDDVADRIQWAERNPARVQQIIQNANHFALRYTTYRARLLYIKYVLLAYKALFEDQEDWFSHGQHFVPAAPEWQGKGMYEFLPGS